MRLGSSIGMGQARRWTGSCFPWEYLGARSVSGDYSTDLCKHMSNGIFLLGVKFSTIQNRNVI